MKMKQEHFDKLKSAVDETLATHNSQGELVACYESGNFARSDKCKDLQKRFCFDVLYGAGMQSFVCDVLYKYLDDSHIYTALKKMCPTVESNKND